jgi:acyl-CoA synthetase (AMP-forming)/AMP-acid ligase II
MDVCTLMRQSAGFADFYLGCAIAGAVRVPPYPRNSREAHADMLTGTGCKVVMADEVHAAGLTALSMSSTACPWSSCVMPVMSSGWLPGLRWILA